MKVCESICSSIYLIAQSVEFVIAGDVTIYIKVPSADLFCHSACRLCKRKCNPVLLGRCDGQSTLTCPALNVDRDWFSSSLISSSAPLISWWFTFQLYLLVFLPLYDLLHYGKVNITFIDIISFNFQLTARMMSRRQCASWTSWHVVVFFKAAAADAGGW